MSHLKNEVDVISDKMAHVQQITKCFNLIGESIKLKKLQTYLVTFF
jgi:hypothetical protein